MQNVTFQELTITQGLATGSWKWIHGGGIYNPGGIVTISTSSTVNGNTAEGIGGGIYNYFGSTIIVNGSVSYNTAVVNGGGIFNSGTLTLQPLAQITNNLANRFGDGVFDLYNPYSSVLVTGATDTTIFGNTSPGCANYYRWYEGCIIGP